MNILYGVPGEGMGHATRSKVVIDFLIQQKHEVRIVSSARAFQFLDKIYPGRVIEIKGFHFAYKNNEVSKRETFMLNLKSASKNLIHNFAKKLLVENTFVPDLVISDFESFTFFFAKLHKLPIISIDNMQIMDRCELTIPIVKDEKTNFKIAKQIVKLKVPKSDYYFISSFFDAKIKKANTTIVPPIIRKAIIDAKISEKNHILMYQTSSSEAKVQEVLSQLPDEKFYVYGMNKDYTEGNVVYKSFSEKGFIDDLASAKAVIANGGFSFISEAVYLMKPIYSFPIHNQFEQYINAAYVQQLNYGRHFDVLAADYLKAFLYELPLFEKNLLNYKQDGNQILFKKLADFLSQYSK